MPQPLSRITLVAPAIPTIGGRGKMVGGSVVDVIRNLMVVAEMSKPKRYVEIAEQEVKRLYQEGLSPEQIANALKISHGNRIKDILESQGIQILCWCGLPRKGHTRCAGCGILVGPKHITKTLKKYKRKGYCDSCLKGRQRKASRGEGEDPTPEELEEDVEFANLGMEDYVRRLWGIEHQEDEKW